VGKTQANTANCPFFLRDVRCGRQVRRFLREPKIKNKIKKRDRGSNFCCRFGTGVCSTPLPFMHESQKTWTLDAFSRPGRSRYVNHASLCHTRRTDVCNVHRERTLDGWRCGGGTALVPLVMEIRLKNLPTKIPFFKIIEIQTSSRRPCFVPALKHGVVSTEGVK